jgi:polyisoprenyl-teichoic acid--peptidoglycan teichoic acid transferase
VRIVRAWTGTLLVVNLLLAAAALGLKAGGGGVVVAQPPPETRTPLPGPTIVVEDESPTAVPADDPARRGRPLGARPELPPMAGLRAPDAVQYGEAVPFVSDEPVPDDLLFVLVIGSDARPGERVDRARADSIHLLAVNPASGTGTVVGFPRDAWVEIPGHGRGKINSALALGGPDLLAETVRRLTGLPVHWWALTGFEGLVRMVDDLGRLVVPVERRMADRNSGTAFDRGFHALSGTEVLAFSRDRTSVARGDFSRSENHGTVILQALRKMRVEVGDTAGVRRWVQVLWRHARVQGGVDDLVRLGATARRLDPDRLVNVVAPGVVGSAGRASVVYLTEDAARLFEDLRDDATVGDAPPPTTTTTTTTSTTTPPTTTPPTTTHPGPSTTSSTVPLP